MVEKVMNSLKENFSKDRMGQRYHRLKLNLRTDFKYQLAVYLIALAIIISLLVLIISSGSNKQSDFVNYQIKKCYDKTSSPSNASSTINYAVAKEKAVVEYIFNQKCYRTAEILPNKDGNHVIVQLSTSDYFEDQCYCSSRLVAEIGLGPGDYTLDLMKKTGTEAYLLKSEKISIK